MGIKGDGYTGKNGNELRQSSMGQLVLAGLKGGYAQMNSDKAASPCWVENKGDNTTHCSVIDRRLPLRERWTSKWEHFIQEITNRHSCY
jgi:hypothetical protein